MTDLRTGLVVERLLPAPPDAVFEAWTDPAILREWMAPQGDVEASADVRVGGSFRILMLGAGEGDDGPIEHTGEYLVVDRPNRLSFTWISPYTGDGPSVVTVTFEPRVDGTWVRLEHEQLPEDHVAGHEDGWGRILERLAGRLAGRLAR